MWLTILNFVWEGDMGDLVWVRIFSLTHNGVRLLFSIIYVMKDIFLVQNIFPQVYPCKLFPLEVSPQDTFEITHNLLKSQIVGR